jgi:hypothetical protein
MSSLKPLIYKSLLLLLILVGVNYIYKYFFLEADLQQHSPIINLVRNVVEDECSVIYLGESSNITTRENDLDKRPISDFISDYYPTIKFGTITKEASHAGIYYELLRNIPENAKVKTVIVTMNMRSFNANWMYSDLETPLQKSLVLLKKYPPLVNRLLLSFRGYDIKTTKERKEQYQHRWKNDPLNLSKPFPYKNVVEWDHGMAAKGIRNSEGKVDEILTALACNYIKTYGFQIDEATNQRISDFDKIVALAKERNWKLVFNLMSENVERAQELVGDDLVYLMKQNRDLLVNRYHKNGVLVVDNLEEVPDEEYIDRNWTTEHYAENGRRIIAKNVAVSMKSSMPKGSFTLARKTEFKNDCEGDIKWNQMPSLSLEKAFEGKQSSKILNGQPYSVTFEYPIKNLPDSVKNVQIEFQLLQSNLANEAKLNIEIYGEQLPFIVNSESLINLTQTLHKWSKVQYQYELPNNFKKGDYIKVYVFNASNTPIYIDDILIRFNE